MEVGTLYYNGFWFPEAIQSSVMMRPIYDSTGRIRKYTAYTIRVEFVIYPGIDKHGSRSLATNTGTSAYTPLFPTTANSNPVTTIDGDGTNDGFSRLRRILTVAGGLLIFTHKGLGPDLEVSGQAGAAKFVDIRFGPKPTLLAFEPLFANNAARVVWEVETIIGDCNSGTGNNITEFAYATQWSIDDAGLTTRTISGFLEAYVPLTAPVTGNESRRVQGTADTYRDRLQFEVPLSFQRISQTYSLSEDRSRLEFQVVDQEHPSDNPLYPGIVQCDIDHTITNSSKQLQGPSWDVSVSGSIRVAKGFPKWYAWVAFLYVVRGRLNAGKTIAEVDVGTSTSPDPKPRQSLKKRATTILDSISITDQVFGRGMSFNIVWKIYTTLDTVLAASGMWLPVEGSDWSTWRGQLITLFNNWAPRGFAQLKHNVSNDVVFNLCTTNVPRILGESKTLQRQAASYDFFSTDKPDKNSSYISFHPYCQLLEYSYTKGLGSDMSFYPSASNSTKPSLNAGDLPSRSDLAANARKEIVQTRGAIFYRVRFYGTAERLGYRIPKFLLKKYGGSDVHLIKTSTWNSGMKFVTPDGTVVYGASWDAEYSLDSVPNGDTFEIDPDPRKFQ